MAKLSDDVRGFIVQALACFDTPTQVAQAVREEFGLDIERMQVASYDPTKVAGKTLSKKWRALFDATRKKFLEEAASVPIAQQAFRLRTLQRLTEQNARNPVLVAALLEQAAKEVGGAFTNTRQLQGPGGGPIPVKAEHVHTLTDEVLAAIAAQGAPAAQP